MLARPHRIGCRYYIKQQYKGVFEKQKIKKHVTWKVVDGYIDSKKETAPMRKPPLLHCVSDRKLCVVLNSGQVLTGTGVDLDLVTVVNEQRNVYGCASLNGCRLGCALSGIALEARLGVGDLKLYE